MPTYEYECTDCRHRFEKSQNMSDPALRECPECHGMLERLIGGGVGIIVKGGYSECGDGRCCMEMSENGCCGGGGPGGPPPCMS